MIEFTTQVASNSGRINGYKNGYIEIPLIFVADSVTAIIIAITGVGYDVAQLLT